MWIKECSPASAVKVAVLADLFVAGRGKVQPWTYAQCGEGGDSNRNFELDKANIEAWED